VSGWLLDTNVISELRRKQPEPAVARFVAEQPLSDLYVSDVTFAEIRFGIELIGDPERRAVLHHWLAQPRRAERAAVPPLPSGIARASGGTALRSALLKPTAKNVRP
jgi:predicted nucleic acid-binding protein